MAIAPPELTIKLNIEGGPEVVSRAKKLEEALERETRIGEAKRENIKKQAEEKRAATDAAALQRQRLAWEKHYNSLAISEEKARLKMLKGQESWSARMTRSLDQVALSVKGFAAAWAIAQASSIVRDSLNFAGGMRDAAAGVNLTTQQFYALTSALRDAGVAAEKIDPMLTRLGELTSGGASPQQQSVLDRLGINAASMSNLQLMDTLLKSINERTITQAELGELVGNRVVPAWNRLANEINNVNDANSKYKFPLTDAEVDRLDEAARKWETTIAKIKLSIAEGFVSGGLGGGWAAAAMARDRAALERYEEFLNGIRANNMRGVIQSAVPFGPPAPTGAPQRPLEIPEPVDASGRRLGFTPPVADRSFQLPQITQQLPVATRQAEEFAASLEKAVSFADMVELRVTQIANSGTWQAATAGAQAFTNIMQLQAQLVQNEVDALNNLMRMERERWEIRSEAMREAGQESSAAYRNELRTFERLDRERQKKAQQLQAKGFEINKRAQIAGTVMNTSQAVMNALATVKPFIPLGLIMSGVAAAQGATQIAMIAQQQNPYRGFAYGGFVHGNGFGDETPILTQGGEFVVTRDGTRRNRAALEFINQGGNVTGGPNITISIQGDVIGDDYYVQTKLIPQIKKAVRQGYQLS